MTQFAWVIEAPGPFYLTAKQIGGWRFDWSEKHEEALRFYNEEQADAVMMSVRELQPALFPICFPRDPRPIEHGWTAPAPSLDDGGTET